MSEEVWVQDIGFILMDFPSGETMLVMLQLLP